MGVLLVFLVFWKWGQYIAPDQQGDTVNLFFFVLVLHPESPYVSQKWAKSIATGKCVLETGQFTHVSGEDRRCECESKWRGRREV